MGNVPCLVLTSLNCLCIHAFRCIHRLHSPSAFWLKKLIARIGDSGVKPSSSSWAGCEFKPLHFQAATPLDFIWTYALTLMSYWAEKCEKNRLNRLNNTGSVSVQGMTQAYGFCTLAVITHCLFLWLTSNGLLLQLAKPEGTGGGRRAFEGRSGAVWKKATHSASRLRC